LIVEYGDLEQLLFPRRRNQAAEAARGPDRERREGADFAAARAARRQGRSRGSARRSRGARARCAQADRVPESDGFSTLTRRVADYSQIDPSDVEADSGNKSAASGSGAPASAKASGGTTGDFFAGSPATARPGADKQDKAASPKGTPISLAAARAEAARKLPVDRSKYQTIRNLDALKAWIARAWDVGHFAIDAQASTDDPMQADICGIALALAPNDACYVPLAHKQSGGGTGLFDAVLHRTRSRPAMRWRPLKPLLESPGILKIGFNIKFNAVMLAQHGITMRNLEDAQLMSYALDAGRNAHGLDGLAERWLGHAVISYGDLTGSGKNKLTFDQVEIDKPPPIRPKSRRDPAAVERAEAAPHRRAHERVYETLERPLVSVLARMERRGISIDRQVLSRLSGDFAQTAARVEASFRRSPASRSMSAAPSRSATSSSARWE